MINKFINWWVTTLYTVMDGSMGKAPDDWAFRVAFVSNLIATFWLAGIMLKLGLRLFGLNHPYFQTVMIPLGFILPYLMFEKIGFSSRYISSFNPRKTKRNTE